MGLFYFVAFFLHVWFGPETIWVTHPDPDVGPASQMD